MAPQLTDMIAVADPAVREHFIGSRRTTLVVDSACLSLCLRCLSLCVSTCVCVSTALPCAFPRPSLVCGPALPCLFASFPCVFRCPPLCVFTAFSCVFPVPFSACLRCLPLCVFTDRSQQAAGSGSGDMTADELRTELQHQVGADLITAFPWHPTAFLHYLSLIFHCRSSPFIVISMPFCTAFHCPFTAFLHCLSSLPSITAFQWQTVFAIAAAIYVFGVVVYALIASGVKQPWADGAVRPASRRGTVQGSM